MTSIYATTSGIRKTEMTVFGALVVLSTCAPLSNLFGSRGAFTSNAFLILSIGVFLMLFFHGSEQYLDAGNKRFILFATLGLITTICMGLILSLSIGPLYGETTITAIIPSICWLAVDVVMVLYLTWAYPRMPRKVLDLAFNTLIIIVLSVSMLEAVLGTRSSLFNSIMHAWIPAYETCCLQGRLCGVASEPSHMALTLGLLCIPYCYGKIKENSQIRYFFALVGLYIVALWTKSTTVYITVTFTTVGMLILTIADNKGINRHKIIIVCLVIESVCVVTLILLTIGLNQSQIDFFDEIKRVFFRSISESDQSGAYRNSTIINDWLIFKSYPVFGVGDGNQGFFYAGNQPSWILSNSSGEVAQALRGAKGVLDGGAFIGSLVSGYGIVGVVLFLNWFIYQFRCAGRAKHSMGCYQDAYYLALFGCMPVLWMSIGFKGAPVAVFLVFCMPSIAASVKSLTTELGLKGYRE